MTTRRTIPPVDLGRDRYRIVVKAGPDEGKSIVVAEEILIGTSEACDLALSDATVSRRHLCLRPTDQGVRVRDEGSRNGTWLALGSQSLGRVFEMDLGPGATLRLGETELTVLAHERSPRAIDEVQPSRDHFGGFIGKSPVLGQLYQRLARAADSDLTVLIEGESGTGKEVIAEAIHDQSPRQPKSFVVVDCGAVPANLIESELFGHERGAFTGADRMRVGAFEQADGGTLFLDEIGELPLAMQTRLLRVLDRGQVRRLGGSNWIDVDVRVVAATNRDLDFEVEEGRFRLDLFHRLAVVLVRVPPLRDRPDDIERLAAFFVERTGGDPSLLSPEVVGRLTSYGWPGNTRELRNYIERLVYLGEKLAGLTNEGDAIGLGTAATSGMPYRRARALALEAFTRTYVHDMLQRHNGNVSQAARTAGVARRTFQRLKQGEGGGDV